jgi:hypothetical protein
MINTAYSSIPVAVTQTNTLAQSKSYDAEKEDVKALTTSDTVNISKSALAQNNWQNIADSYDVTNITHNEAGEMVTKLSENGLITSTNSLYMMAPPNMNFDPDSKYDLLGSTEQALVNDKANGASEEHIKNMESVVDILQYIQKLSDDS